MMSLTLILAESRSAEAAEAACTRAARDIPLVGCDGATGAETRLLMAALREIRTSSCPFSAAQSSGERLCASTMVGSAPASRSSLTMSTWPQRAARRRAVSCPSFVTSRFRRGALAEPRWRSRCTTLAWPYAAARCRAVLPIFVIFSRRSKPFAPVFDRRKSITSKQPSPDAVRRGVRPAMSSERTSAPSSYRRRKMRGWLEAACSGDAPYRSTIAFPCVLTKSRSTCARSSRSIAANIGCASVAAAGMAAELYRCCVNVRFCSA